MSSVPNTKSNKFNDLIEKLISKDKSIVFIKNVGDGFIGVLENNNDEIKRPVFKEAEIVIAYHWDKNAVCYNLDISKFPNAKTIVLAGTDPCDYVPLRFKDANWFTVGNKRYFQDIPNHTELNNEQMDEIVQLGLQMPHWGASDKHYKNTKIFLISKINPLTTNNNNNDNNNDGKILNNTEMNFSRLLELLKTKDAQKIVVIKEIGDGAMAVIENNELKTPVFSQAEIVILYRWDKNAVYYNLDKIRFPNAKIIVLAETHPCEYSVPFRFENAYWFVSGYNRYFEGIKNYNNLTSNEISEIIKLSLEMDHWVVNSANLSYSSYYHNKTFIISKKYFS